MWFQITAARNAQWPLWNFKNSEHCSLLQNKEEDKTHKKQ